jgi:hypothetical protein
METENTSDTEGVTQTEETETVEIHEASDEEIKAFLNQATGDETEEAEQDVPQTESEADTAQETADPVEEESQEEPPPQEATSTPEASAREAQLEAEAARLRQQMEAQRRFIERRSTDYGELKKYNHQRIAQLSENLEEMLLENPVEGHKRLLEIQEREKANEQADHEINLLQTRQKSQEVLSTHLKPTDWDAEGMLKALESDGVSPAYINAFRRDPLGVAQPDTIIQLAKRAKAESLLMQVVQHYKALKKEADGYKSKLKAMPTDIARKIDEVGRRSPMVSAKTGTSKPRAGTPESTDPSTWSDEQVKAFLQSN